VANLDIIIRAIDQASGPIGGIAKSLGNLDGASKVAQQGFGGLQKAVGVGLKAGLGAAIAGVTGLGAGLASAVSAGSDVEEMMGKFSVVFANTGDLVTSQLDDFGRAVGRNKYELREMAATFGDTLKPMGFAEEDAADLSVTLSKLAIDLGSFNNMDSDEALRRLQGTLIGSHENALAFGVVINENTLKAEMLAQGWSELTGAELEAAKVQARINLLMKGTTDAQGDAARTSESWANQMRGLQSVIQETQAEIGTKLLPVLTPLLAKFSDMASQYAPALIDGFAGILDKVVVFAEALLTWDTSAVPFLATLENIATQVMAVIQPIWDAVSSFVGWQDVLIAVGVVVASIVIPALAGIIAAAAPVIAVGVALVASVALIRKAWENDWGGIRTALTSWWDGTGKPIFEQLKTWLATNLPKALSTLKEWWDSKLLPAIRVVWSFIENNVIPIMAALADVWLAGVKVQLTLLGAAWENILKPALQALWSFITTYVAPALSSMVGGVEGISSAVSTAVGWLDRLTGWLTRVADKISNMPSLSFGGIGSMLGFASGTPYAPGGMAYVHAGEMVALPRGSRVHTANETAAMRRGGSGDTYVTMNVYGGNAQEIARTTEHRLLDLQRRRGL